MPKCQVTLTANSGVLIECNGTKVCCDAFHDDKAVEFSTVSPEMQQHMLESPAFQNPDMIFYTHNHRDHYTRPAAEQACKRSPGALLVSPMQELDNSLLLCEDTHRLKLGNAEFSFKHLRHDGKEYIDLPNYGCLINFDGFRVLILGDCVICNPVLEDWIKDTPVDLALLNFPWLTLKRGRTFIADVIRPRHVMFYHLPFVGDDVGGYRKMTAKNLPLITTPQDVRVLQEPFQTETVE
ncbi:MBL fold metallo-hydrolase [Oscillospiraceae bacterium LTW-04]|nr:MBL fold metallo-hydrolase [Oscillospiraceae bacterium MB24-C1]